MTIMMKMIMIVLTMLMLMVPSKKPTNRVLFISVIPPRCCSHSHYWQTTIRKKQLGTIPNILEVGVAILHLQNTHINLALMTVRKNVQPYPTFWKYISVDTLQIHMLLILICSYGQTTKMKNQIFWKAY